MALAPVPAEILARGLHGLPGGAELLVMALAPIAAEIFPRDFRGLLHGHSGLGVFQAGDDAGGLLQQVGPDGLFLVHQQHAIAHGVALAHGGQQGRPFFHGLALVAGQVHAALLHHPVECRKAVVPPAGDLDLIGGDGGCVHVQPIAGEPGLDVLGALDLVAAGRGGRHDAPPADVPPQHRAEHHQRTAYHADAHLFEPGLFQRYHKHIPFPPTHLVVSV